MENSKNQYSKSRKPSVRIKRVIKELDQTNSLIGNVLFEQIINIGIHYAKIDLDKMEKDDRLSIIHPRLYRDAIQIIEKHLES